MLRLNQRDVPISRGEGGSALLAALIGVAVSGLIIAGLAIKGFTAVNAAKVTRARAEAQDSNVSSFGLVRSLLTRPNTSLGSQSAGNLPAIFPDPYVVSPDVLKVVPINSSTVAGLWSATSLVGAKILTVKTMNERKVTTGQINNVFSGAIPDTPLAEQPMLTSTTVKITAVHRSGLAVTDMDVQAITPNPDDGNPVPIKANIKIELPPVPNCSLSASAGGVIPYGSNVQIYMAADGVAASADITYAQAASQQFPAGWAPPSAPTAANSVKNTGVNIGTWYFTANPAWPPGISTPTYPWTITGQVNGITGGSNTCSLTLTVQTPPPTCVVGGTATNPIDAGIQAFPPVTSAAIDGTAVTLNGALAGSLTVPMTGQTTWIIGQVWGPGGTTTCSTPIWFPNCTPLGWVFYNYESYDAGYCPTNDGQKPQTGAFPLIMVTSNLGFTHVDENWQYCDSHYHAVTFQVNYFVDTAFYGPAGTFCPYGEISENLIANDDGCLDGDTLVATADGAQRPIREIKAGDRLAGLNGGPPILVEKVFATPANGETLYRIELGKSSLLLTGNHPVVTRSGIRTAATLMHGDDVADGKGGWQRVAAVRPVVSGSGDMVYNLRVQSPDHLFLADGVAVGDIDLQGKLSPPVRRRPSPRLSVESALDRP